MCIDDFVSKPVNPVQFPEAIERAFSRQSYLKKARLAREAGLDRQTIEENTQLLRTRRSDTRIFTVLKVSSGMDIPAKDIAGTDRSAIARPGGKIRVD